MRGWARKLANRKSKIKYLKLGGRPIARHQDGKTYFVHPNQLGSTTMVTDQTGATIQKTIYYPWGQAWASSSLVRDNRFASMDPRDARVAQTSQFDVCESQSHIEQRLLGRREGMQEIRFHAQYQQ